MCHEIMPKADNLLITVDEFLIFSFVLRRSSVGDWMGAWDDWKTISHQEERILATL